VNRFPGGDPTEEALLYYEEIPSSHREAPALMLLHGRGADERDLLPVVDYIAKGWNAVSIRAPFEFPGGGFAWYDFLREGGPEPKSLRQSLNRLASTLADIHDSNPTTPFVLLGFSQGSLMALSVATLRPARLKGVVALSGYMPSDELLPAPIARLRGLPIFQTHARNDFVLPYAWAVATRDRLTRAGAQVTWLEHSAGHSIPLDAMDRVSTWLAETASR